MALGKPHEGHRPVLWQGEMAHCCYKPKRVDWKLLPVLLSGLYTSWTPLAWLWTSQRVVAHLVSAPVRCKMEVVFLLDPDLHRY